MTACDGKDSGLVDILMLQQCNHKQEVPVSLQHLSGRTFRCGLPGGRCARGMVTSWQVSPLVEPLYCPSCPYLLTIGGGGRGGGSDMHGSTSQQGGQQLLP